MHDDGSLMTDLSPTPTEPDHAPSGLPRWLPVALGLLAVVALLGFIAATSSSGDDTPGAIGEFSFQTSNGGSVTLDDFQGTPLVVNYFAGWCPPCRAELPDFEAVHQETAGEVMFVGISRDTLTSEWQALVTEFDITYTTVFEGNVQGSFAFLEATAMPTTAFISADGTVERVWSGALTDDKLRELIAEHLT